MGHLNLKHSIMIGSAKLWSILFSILVLNVSLSLISISEKRVEGGGSYGQNEGLGWSHGRVG